MTTTRPKAKTWKRVVVFLGTAMCLGIGALMGLVPDGDTFFQQYGKWMFCAFLVIGGVWLLVIAIRGNRRQTDKTLDRMSSGWQGGL